MSLKKYEEGATEKNPSSRNLKELISHYDNLILKYKKAEKYFDCCDLNVEELDNAIKERKKIIPKLGKIILDLDLVGKEIEKVRGYKLTEKEILEGFGGYDT